MKILKSILNYIPLATFIIFVVTDGIFSLISALIFVISTIGLLIKVNLQLNHLQEPITKVIPGWKEMPRNMATLMSSERRRCDRPWVDVVQAWENIIYMVSKWNMVMNIKSANLQSCGWQMAYLRLNLTLSRTKWRRILLDFGHFPLSLLHLCRYINQFK